MPRFRTLTEPVRVEPPPRWEPARGFYFPELTGPVAVDLETYDPGLAQGTSSSWAHRDMGHVCGVAIAWENNSFYLPLRHAVGNIGPTNAMNWLCAQLEKPDVTPVMANAPYDLGWLRREGICPINPPADVQAMAALLDEHRFSYSLDSLGKDFLGIGKMNMVEPPNARIVLPNGTVIDDPMSSMHQLPAWLVEPYAKTDAMLTLKLYHHFRPKIAAEELETVYELERQCAVIVTDMRERGVRVDLDQAERTKREFERRRDAAIHFIHETTGIAVAPFANDAIFRALRAENSSVSFPLTASGRPSMRRDIVETIDSPVARAVVTARRYDKAINTFLTGYLLGHTHNGRIHAEFHSLRRDDDEGGMKGTISGRFSSSNPNLQNISKRDPEMKAAIRGCFLPDEGGEWGKWDWSGQELRVGLHFAYLTRRKGAAEMRQRYMDNPDLDLHAETARIMGVTRDQAKVITLGINYGMGGGKLCKQLGLPTEMATFRDGTTREVAGREGQELMRRHLQAVPYVKQLYLLAKQTAESRGYVKTITGRRCRFKKDARGRVQFSHAAVNRIVQGSSADQCKLVLAAMRQEGVPVQITVHDEINLTLTPGDETARRRITELMENTLPLTVPTRVDAKFGPNWGAV